MEGPNKVEQSKGLLTKDTLKGSQKSQSLIQTCHLIAMPKLTAHEAPSVEWEMSLMDELDRQAKVASGEILSQSPPPIWSLLESWKVLLPALSATG